MSITALGSAPERHGRCGALGVGEAAGDVVVGEVAGQLLVVTAEIDKLRRAYRGPPT